MRFVAILALAALVTAPALGQTPTAPVDEPAPTVVPLQSTALDFTEVLVVADIVRPTGDIFQAPPKPTRTNLIKLRASFRPELARSASALR